MGAVRTYSWVPPCPPEPMTRRRMLRHNSLEAWETAQDRLEVLSPACPLMSEGGAGEGTRVPAAFLRRVEWGQAEGPASFLRVAFTRWSAAHCGHDPYRHDTTLSGFGCRSILVGWNCPGPSGLEIQEAALAISRSCNWLCCRFSVGTFQADLSVHRRRCERQFSTVLIAANVTRQVRQKSL